MQQIELVNKFLILDLFRNEKPVDYDKVNDKDKKYYIVPLKLVN